ncbi:MAG: ABC transporter permease, partial [Candidatus Muiribacteriaceae bacterium]
MNLIESVVTASSEITHHKLRAFLTILGVIFGVGSVISMMSIGAGAEREAVRQIEAMGADNITVRAKKLIGKAYREAMRSFSEGLSIADRDYIQQNIPAVKKSTVQILVKESVAYGKVRPEANIVGVDGQFSEVLKKNPVFGRNIDRSDVRELRKVCVLGYNTAKKMFHNEDPTGKIVMIGGVRFIVIGSMSDATFKSSSVTGESAIDINSRDVNNDIYIPVSVVNTSFPRYGGENGFADSESDPAYSELSEIVFQVDSMDNIQKAAEVIRKILGRRHYGIDDFEIVIPLEKLEQKKQTQKIFNIVMTGIAALSLLVGGIGIMNIMLASVSERTREIGVRRAIGASRKEIMMQFITEALVLSVAGGVLGIIAGVLISLVV